MNTITDIKKVFRRVLIYCKISAILINSKNQMTQKKMSDG